MKKRIYGEGLCLAADMWSMSCKLPSEGGLNLAYRNRSVFALTHKLIVNTCSRHPLHCLLLIKTTTLNSFELQFLLSNKLSKYCKNNVISPNLNFTQPLFSLYSRINRGIEFEMANFQDLRYTRYFSSYDLLRYA